MKIALRVGESLLVVAVALLAIFGAVSLVFLVFLYKTVPVAASSTVQTGAPAAGDVAEPETGNTTDDRYLDLLKRYLTRYDFDDYRRIPSPLDRYLQPRRLALVKVSPLQELKAARAVGLDWPQQAETMIGLRRLDNIEYCIRDVLDRHVPGDVIEAGAWRGGATIFMRAVLKTYGDNARKVWVADSFEGLPKPDTAAYPIDGTVDIWAAPEMAVSLEEVKHNFARYGLLDDQVRFLKGWFKDTLPNAPIERLSVLRVDGDLYESTMEALRFLYPKVSVGGYIIDDDYGSLATAKKAVDDFRAQQGIASELKHIDWTGVYWQRTK